MPNCPKCGLNNPETAAFCMRCGKEIHDPGAPSMGDQFCYKHPKVATQLACGRCGRPVCTKCVVLGPAGSRCRECSRSSVAYRPAALLYGIKRGFLGLFRSGPWTIYIWILLISTVFGLIRGCSTAPHSRQVPLERPDPELR
ncbi:MAG: zinc-ribbon domain-containing protein [Chthonomonadaceae bacterium]|nr:zinc-ribbon domain-containing protein [Chthonomonadaceae bacterium]